MEDEVKQKGGMCMRDACYSNLPSLSSFVAFHADNGEGELENGLKLFILGICHMMKAD